MTWFMLPAVGALIGWMTNFLAVKMLFHPRKPLRLGPLVIQGVFPKRQKELAEKLGQIVSEELFSVDDIERHLRTKAGSPAVREAIEAAVDRFLLEKLFKAVPLAAMLMTPDMLVKIKRPLLESLQEGIQGLLDSFHEELKRDLDVHEIVRTKVENFSILKLEAILFSIMAREFRLIEWIGGLLGFLIGLLQVFLSHWLSRGN